MLIKPILARFGERSTIILGNGIFCATMLGMGFATESWMIFALLPLAALAEIAGPAITASAANMVPNDAQGELQGLFGSVEAVSAIASPAIMTGPFAYFTADAAPVYFPGAPFLLAGIIVVFAVLIFLKDAHRQ